MAALEEIKEEKPPSDSPTTAWTGEAVDFERRKLELELEERTVDMTARKAYAGRIFWLAVGWLFAVFVLLLLHGFGERYFHWRPLPDGVMIALVAGATAGVIGLMASVIAYVFRVRK